VPAVEQTADNGTGVDKRSSPSGSSSEQTTTDCGGKRSYSSLATKQAADNGTDVNKRSSPSGYSSERTATGCGQDFQTTA
jgi:hypothetical protein